MRHHLAFACHRMIARSWTIRPTYAPGRCARARVVRIPLWGQTVMHYARCETSASYGHEDRCAS